MNLKLGQIINKELRSFYKEANIIRTMNISRIQWTGYV